MKLRLQDFQLIHRSFVNTSQRIHSVTFEQITLIENEKKRKYLDGTENIRMKVYVCVLINKNISVELHAERRCFQESG